MKPTFDLVYLRCKEILTLHAQHAGRSTIHRNFHLSRFIEITPHVLLSSERLFILSQFSERSIKNCRHVVETLFVSVSRTDLEVKKRLELAPHEICEKKNSVRD